MSRTRAFVVVAVLVVFVVAGGVLIYLNTRHPGENRIFDVTVTAGGTMSPETLEPAHVGDTITISIKSDQDGEVHLHEYDIAFDAKAGQVVSHTFKADRTCRCLVEWESTSTELGFLVVSP